MRFIMKTIVLLFVGAVPLIAIAANPAVGLYENQRQKDSAYKIRQQQPSPGGEQLGFMKSNGTRANGNGTSGTYDANDVAYDNNGRAVGGTGEGTLFVDNNGRLKDSQGGDNGIRSLNDAKLNRLKQMKESIGNGVCLDKQVLAREDADIREVGRGYLNGQGQLPESPREALKDESCRQLDYGKSFLHDFNENVAQICNASPETRTICYLLAVSEFLGGLPQGTILNVEREHNIKIVCDGGEEYVFDKDGRIVESGINEGTFNLSSPEDWVGHAINDILAAIEKLPAKSSLSKEDAIKILDDCIRRRREIVLNAESSTRSLFAGKKTSSSKDAVLAAKSASSPYCAVTGEEVIVEREKDTSQVGVRGWCTCGEEHGKIYQCGMGSFMPGFNLGDYLYELCGRCGKILKPDKNDKQAKIIDMRIHRKFKASGVGLPTIPTHEYEARLKQAENKLLDIPDGGTVIHGACVCKVPDPIHVGFLDRDYEPYVCLLCGRVRLPDADGGIPNGPTALSEMRLDKQAEAARKRMSEWLDEICNNR